MSTTTLNFIFKIGGVLTDATSVVLRDPDNTYGVRRKDTLAVVVAAGEPMAHESLGTYTYPFTDPAAGLLYDYWIEAVHAGVTYRYERATTRPAGMSTSYLTVEAADALADALPELTAWTPAVAASRAVALEQATSDIDAAMPYQGRRFDDAQILQFPRIAFAHAGDSSHPAGEPPTVWDLDEAGEAAVPRDVLLATLIQADAILSGSREPRLAAQHDGVVYELTGTLAESYKRNTGPGVTTGLCRRAWVLMRKYRLRGGKML